MFGPKGVAVAAAIDEVIEITVLQDAGPSAAVFYGSGDILVGNQGLIIGNEVAGTTEVVPWPTGRVHVQVFGDGPKDTATRITFVVKDLQN